MTIQSTKVYFPSLNGLRFIAVLAIVIHNLEYLKFNFGLDSAFYEAQKNPQGWPLLPILGDLGITLFFTLSGFLITYLLLTEKERFRAINIKQFYMRRVMRVMPLYLLITPLCLWILLQFDFFKIPVYTEGYDTQWGLSAFLNMFFLPQIASIFSIQSPLLMSLLGISGLVYFYLIWPWVISATKQYLTVFIGIFIFFALISSGLYHFSNNSISVVPANIYDKMLTFAHLFFSCTRLGCMAMGGIGAYLLFTLNNRFLKPVFSIYTQLITGVILIELMLFGVQIPYIHHEIFAFIFTIIILNLAANPECLTSLESPSMNYLGKISFSIVMWHGIALMIGFHTARFVQPNMDNLFSNIVYYSTTILFALIFGIVSYEFFEKRFLGVKSGFTKVKSGDIKINIEEIQPKARKLDVRMGVRPEN
jgi:peptidoglycan/LPS O-acetylase OafA/YrhL